MKSFLLATVWSFFLCQINAQPTGSLIHIKGLVVDSASAKPLAFATLVLQNAKTKVPVKNFISKDDGSFERFSD